MKKIKLLILSSLVLLGTVTFAQTQKFGHIDSQELVALMPEKTDADKKLKTYTQELRKTSETMQKEYQQKIQDYTANQATDSEFVKKSKEEAIRNLQERMQQFEMNAQKDLQRKQKDLYEPIIKKARKAVSDVARKQGITYVFDKSSGALIFEGKGCINLLDPVKKSLNIK